MLSTEATTFPSKTGRLSVQSEFSIRNLARDWSRASWFLRHAPESVVPESIVLSEPGQGIRWSGEVIGERTNDGAQMRFNVSFAACVTEPAICVG